MGALKLARHAGGLYGPMLFIPPAGSDYLRSPLGARLFVGAGRESDGRPLLDESVSERTLIGSSMGTVVGRGSSFPQRCDGRDGRGERSMGLMGGRRLSARRFMGDRKNHGMGRLLDS